MTDEERHREMMWAILRLVLGFLQIVGAATALIFLLQTGPSWLTFAATGTTLLVTGLVCALSGQRWRKRSARDWSTPTM